MVEFISEAAEQAENEEPPPEEEESSQQDSLEELVEAEAEELRAPEPEQEYVNETPESEYTHMNEFSIDVRESKIRPLVYVENGMPVVVDIFELYSKIQPEDDKSWKKLF